MASSNSTSASAHLPFEIWCRIMDYYLDGKALPTIRYNSLWSNQSLLHVDGWPAPAPPNTPSPAYYSESFSNGVAIPWPHFGVNDHALSAACPWFMHEYWGVQMLKHTLVQVDLDVATLRDPVRLAAVFHPDPVPRQTRYLYVRVAHSDNLRGTDPQTIADMQTLRTWLHQFPNLELLSIDCVQHPTNCLFPQQPCGSSHWMWCSCTNAAMLPLQDWLANDKATFKFLNKVWIMRQKWVWDERANAGQGGFVRETGGPVVPLGTREAWWRIMMDKVHQEDIRLVAWTAARSGGGQGA